MAKRSAAVSVGLVFTLGFASSVSACGDDPAPDSVSDAGEAQVDAAAFDGTTDALADAQVTTDAKALTDASSGEITVNGKLVAALTLNAAVGTHNVVLVDARGKKFLQVAASSFQFVGVLPPYDVRIGLPNEPASLGTAWLGVTRNDPTFHTTDIFPSGGTYRHAMFNINLTQPPPCSAAYCEVRVAGFSANTRGGGGTGGTYYPSTPTTFSGEFSWYYTPGDPPLDITWDILTAEPTFSAFYYQRVSTFGVVPDETRTINALPAGVPNIGNFTAVSSPINIPSDWERRIQVSLTFPFGGTVALATASADTIVSGIPNIAGATVSGTSFGNAPPPDLTHIYEMARADSATLPISATSAALTLARGPTMINPTKGITTNLQVLSWTNHPSVPQAKSIRLYNVTENVPKADAYVGAEQSVALKRFEALGWPITPGEYSFRIATSAPFSSMDEFVAPNAQPFYATNAQRTSTMDFRYTYTP